MLSVVLVSEDTDLLSHWHSDLAKRFAVCEIEYDDPRALALSSLDSRPARIYVEFGRPAGSRVQWLEIVDLDREFVDQFEPEDLANIQLVVPSPSFYSIGYDDLKQLAQVLSTFAGRELWVDDGFGLFLPVTKFVEVITARSSAFMDRLKKPLP